jgi:hypothetical protein
VRFLFFLLVVLLMTLVLLYVVGDRRQPTQTIIEQEVEIEAQPG